jgi:hypothetical protein
MTREQSRSGLRLSQVPFARGDGGANGVNDGTCGVQCASRDDLANALPIQLGGYAQTQRERNEDLAISGCCHRDWLFSKPV